MAELKTLIDGKRVSYTGLFRLNELYDIIKRFFGSRGYFMFETRNREETMPDGKHIWITMEPEKTASDYVKRRIKIDIVIKSLKDRDVTLDGHKQKWQHGTIDIDFFATLRTDYRNKWEGNGLLFLLRTLSDKFVKRDSMHEAEDDTMHDCLQLQEEVKAYLNMSRFTVSHHDNKNKPA